MLSSHIYGCPCSAKFCSFVCLFPPGSNEPYRLLESLLIVVDPLLSLLVAISSRGNLSLGVCRYAQFSFSFLCLFLKGFILSY